MPALPVPVLTIGLLIASNVFMTFAWYSHLKHLNEIMTSLRGKPSVSDVSRKTG